MTTPGAGSIPVIRSYGSALTRPSLRFPGLRSWFRPFTRDWFRVGGLATAAVVAAGRKPRRRIAGLMIAATAISEDLPLYTTNPGDYAGLEKLVRVIAVTRPLAT